MFNLKMEVEHTQNKKRKISEWSKRAYIQKIKTTR